MNRFEAAKAGLTLYDGSGPCHRGHEPVRIVSTGQCLACEEERKVALKAMRAGRKADKKSVSISTAQGFPPLTVGVHPADIETVLAVVAELRAAREPSLAAGLQAEIDALNGISHHEHETAAYLQRDRDVFK